MTLEKIMEEFSSKFIEDVPTEDDFVLHWRSSDDYGRETIKTFLRKALSQYATHVIEEVMPEENPYSADPSNPIKHVRQNEGYNQALMDIRANLDKMEI